MDQFYNNASLFAVVSIHSFFSPFLRPLDISRVESTPRILVWTWNHGYQLSSRDPGINTRSKAWFHFNHVWTGWLPPSWGRIFVPLESFAINQYLVENITSLRGKMIWSRHYDDSPAVRWEVLSSGVGDCWATEPGSHWGIPRTDGETWGNSLNHSFESPLPNGECAHKHVCVYL